MKKVIISSCFALFCLVSCKDSFLELPSQTSLSTTTFFKTESDFVQGVNAAYAPLRALYNGSTNNPNQGAWVMGEMHSDNTTFILNPGYRATIDQEQAASFSVEAPNAVSTAKYVTDYQIIARANQVLASIDKVEFTAATKSNLKGQAQFLRAFAYFDLVQYFGKVPLHLTPVTTRAEASLPLSEVAAVYTQIVQDLTEAAKVLPVKSKQEAGRATQGAANALLANVYIVQKKWAEAETLLNGIVSSNEYELLADYAAPFATANKNNKESVFEVQFKEGTDGYASAWAYQWLPMPITAAQVATISGAANAQALTTEGYNIPTPDMVAAYETKDKRKDISIATVTVASGTYPYIKKFWQPHAQAGIMGNNWPVYRYAEVLLFLAEVQNELNKTANAATTLNLIRTRAGLPATTAATQAALRDAIMQERRVELAFENKRWTDLVRTGTATSVITAYGAKVKANPQTYYYPAGLKPNTSDFAKVDLVFPLPASESLLSAFF
jgi:hypothetical protein